jgi:hypothetical protein
MHGTRKESDALHSLMMATKSPTTGPHIERCLVTGVARFAHTSLFSGANNFADLTGSPLLSRVLGFSEAEIRASFPGELKRLVAGLGVGSTDAAVAKLAHWYNGYCFDGVSSSFNPFPVLQALKAGTITERRLTLLRVHALRLHAKPPQSPRARTPATSPSCCATCARAPPRTRCARRRRTAGPSTCGEARAWER